MILNQITSFCRATAPAIWVQSSIRLKFLSLKFLKVVGTFLPEMVLWLNQSPRNHQNPAH